MKELYLMEDLKIKTNKVHDELKKVTLTSNEKDIEIKNLVQALVAKERYCKHIEEVLNNLEDEAKNLRRENLDLQARTESLLTKDKYIDELQVGIKNLESENKRLIHKWNRDTNYNLVSEIDFKSYSEEGFKKMFQCDFTPKDEG